MKSNENFLLLLLILFALGASGIYFINRKKEKHVRINAWKKYFTYFFIINSFFVFIMYAPALFRGICFLIVLGGAFEMFRLQRNSHQQQTWSRFAIYFLTYTVTSVLFCFLAFENKEILVLMLFTVCVFDAFSQLSGQMFGKRKICPRISPNKTIGGTIGGTVAALILGIIANFNSLWEVSHVVFLIIFVAIASFAGDLAASYVKRLYAVKDYGRLLPGHGGILDRFDSLIAAGALMFLLKFYWS